MFRNDAYNDRTSSRKTSIHVFRVRARCIAGCDQRWATAVVWLAEARAQCTVTECSCGSRVSVIEAVRSSAQGTIIGLPQAFSPSEFAGFAFDVLVSRERPFKT
jgi:hypothetical protein